MRIDGANPISSVFPDPGARQPKRDSTARTAGQNLHDRVEIQRPRQASSINILVEIRSPNVVVYKYRNESDGQIIDQIPSEQMLDLVQAGEASKGK